MGVHDVSTSKTRKYTWSRTSSDAVTTAQYNAYIKPYWGPGKKSGTTDTANKCMVLSKCLKVYQSGIAYVIIHRGSTMLFWGNWV